MIRAIVALAVLVPGIPLGVTATVNNEFSSKRVVVVSAHTAAGASCSLADALTGLRLHATATNAGGVTWRWRPSVWANGADSVDVRCAKGSAHRSINAPLVFLVLQQITMLRHYGLHLVYWGQMPAEVEPAVARLEADVKTSLDAGATDNPFAVPRAYGDSLGRGDPRIASIDSTTVTDPFPKKPALTRADVGREVTRLVRQHGWAAGNRSLVMVFTPPSVTVCVNTRCTPLNEPCGFHSLTHAGYAYADVIMSGNAAYCGGSVSPAHYAIALLGHEQNEAVVDPQGFGLEVADTCQGDSKSVSINGHAYDLPAIELPTTKCAFGYTP